MTETVEERLARITEYVDVTHNVGASPLLNTGDLNWLIARAGLAGAYGAYIDGNALGMESMTRYTIQIKDENKQLREAIKQALEKHKWNNEESARILEQALEGLK